MKIIFYLFFFIIVINCSTKKGVYWCGDHPCINKEEKETYFKKTMIVEIKEIKKDISNENSNIEKIIQQAKTDEKKRINEEKNMSRQVKLDKKSKIKQEKYLNKQTKLEKKRRIKEEKYLKKQAKLDEKKRIKEEKNLAKKINLDEKKIIKNKKKKSKQKTKIYPDIKNIEIKSTDFKKLVERITKKNTLKPYPDINDIPE